MECRRYEITNKLRKVLKREGDWSGLFKVTLITTAYNSQPQNLEWELHWVGHKLECISCEENFFYATDDLERCLFIAHSKEIGIKERIEFSVSPPVIFASVLNGTLMIGGYVLRSMSVKIFCENQFKFFAMKL